MGERVEQGASREGSLLAFGREFKLVELTRSRRKKFREAVAGINDAPEDSEDDDHGVKLVAQAIAACVESEEIEGLLLDAWMSDSISEAAVGRLFQAVMDWEDGEVQGEA